VRSRFTLPNSTGRLRAALVVCVRGVALLALAVGASLPVAAQEPGPALLQMTAWLEEGEKVPQGMRDLIEGFAQSQPRARVNLIHDRWREAPTRLRYWRGSLRDYAPDLTILRDVWLPECAPALLPLSPEVTPAALKHLAPSVVSRCALGEQLLAVPWQLTARALYYRTDLFEQQQLKVPKTLAELALVARKLSRPPDVYGLGLPGAGGGDGALAFVGLLGGMGGRVVDADGKLELTSGPGVAALQYWVELSRTGAVPPETLSWTAADLQAAFAAGRLGMVLAGPEFGRRLRTQCPDLKFAVAAAPADKGSANLVSCDVVVALGSSRHPREAREFLRFVARAETQRALSMSLGLPTVKTQISEAKSDFAVGPFVARIEEALGWPLSNQEVVAEAVDQALFLALSGRQEPQAALQLAVKAATAPPPGP
jgi:ABC-type glycerol-3-phosphate transport system substrate-binding protein